MKKIAISQLGLALFCEYKLVLKAVKKKPAPMTPTIKKGIQAHRELEQEHIKRERMKEALKKAGIKLPKEEKQTKREFRIVGDKIVGKADEIEVYDTFIRIIDDKPRDQVYYGDKMQVFGYCLAYRQEHKDKIADFPMKGAVRNWKTKSIVWEEDFTDDWQTKVSDLVDRIEGIIAGKVEPIPTKNPNKCNKCNMINYCDKATTSV